MRLSHRLDGGMTPNALAALLAEKRRAGTTIYDLAESNPTRAGIRYPADFLSSLADPRALVYEPEPFGLPSARECIAREYGAPYENTILTASTSEAYSWILKLLCNPGDEIIVPRPSYPLFEYLAALESVRTRHYGLFYDHGWYIDFHTVERAISERTRALVLVNPNNPTGHYIHAHELGELVALCQRRKIAIVSDEVFADYPIDPAADSVRTLRGVADFALSGLSKVVGLPQMKLAWMVLKDAPPAELELIADTYLTVGTPVQTALPGLLGLREPVQTQIRARALINLAQLPRHLPVEAGWYAILPVPDGEETALQLLRERDILVQPGYFYDFDKPGCIVVSLLTPPEVLSKLAGSTAAAEYGRFP